MQRDLVQAEYESKHDDNMRLRTLALVSKLQSFFIRSDHGYAEVRYVK